MEEGRVSLIVLLLAAFASIPLFLVPPSGAYLLLGAVLFWRWVRGRLSASGLKAVTRVVVWSLAGAHLIWLVLGIGICGPRLLLFVCDA